MRRFVSAPLAGRGRPHACRRRAGTGKLERREGTTLPARSCLAFSLFPLLRCSKAEISRGGWRSFVAAAPSLFILVSSGGIFPSSFSLLLSPFLFIQKLSPQSKTTAPEARRAMSGSSAAEREAGLMIGIKHLSTNLPAFQHSTNRPNHIIGFAWTIVPAGVTFFLDTNRAR